MNYAKDITAEYTASYAKYVATSRSVANLVDGLKPVQRRCVNSADDLKLYHDKKFLKVAKLEGQVMGDYHPHGGASMIILAQPFKTRYPLFEGQGNFGCPDNPNSVAASRYIETRMTKFCEDFYLSSADYADRELNYDGRLKEVVQYYPPIPGVLLTGSSGIAVGLSTNIPPHRISDVCKSLAAYITSPDTEEYLDCMMPETCEESIILTPKSEIKELYTKGEGSILYKAKTHYESVDGKLALVVDAFPPDYNKKRLDTSFIIEAVEAGTLELRNESSTGIRYVFISPSKDILESVEERLTSSSGYRMYIEYDDKIHLYKLSELYDDFLKARKAYIVKKYSDLIKKNKEECEYIRVLLALKKDQNYIKSMFDKSPKEVAGDIIRKFSTTSDIASRILGSSLSSMMKDNAEKLEIKYNMLQEQIVEYTTYVEKPINRILIDISNLYENYQKEERRASHIDDIEDTITIDYKGKKISTHPSSLFYVAHPDNTYEVVHAAELLERDLNDSYVVAGEYKYYVLYDSKGVVAVSADVMKGMDSKLKSDKLLGFIGTDDLEEITMVFNGTKTRLGDWTLRVRKSYIDLSGGKAGTLKLG